MKQGMSSADVAAVVGELQWLKGAKIEKVYQHSPTEIRLRLRHREKGSLDLIIEAGRRIHLTKYPKPSPKFPSNFAMFLRKHIGGGRISAIRQHDFDRVVLIDVETWIDGERRTLTLVAELLPRGNVVLLDEDGRILLPLKTVEFSARALKRGEHYEFPPPKPSPLNIDEKTLKEIFKASKKDVVRTLATQLNLGGLFAEEICLRAGVEKDEVAASLDDEQVRKLHAAIKELFSPLFRGELKPHIVLAAADGAEATDAAPEKKYDDVLPFELKIYERRNRIAFDSFNEALDEFFTTTTVEAVREELEELKNEKLEKYRRILKEQEQALEKLEEKEATCVKKAEALYTHYAEVEAALTATGGDASQKLEINKKARRAVLQLPTLDFDFELELGEFLDAFLKGELTPPQVQKIVQRSAQRYYEEAKALRRKKEGVKKAIQEVRMKIEHLEEELERELFEAKAAELYPQRRIKRRERWYERYRWFETSDGFLCVGGKDATTNEELVKKHMESTDLFFHTETPGAPVVILKTGGQEVPERSLHEAAQFAAAYSSMWKHGFAEADCYCVAATQVSKTPESGEYIKKGSFIVRGQRRYFKVPLRLCIGLEINEETRLIAGPPQAVRQRAKYCVEIEPGDVERAELSKRIFDVFMEKVSDVEKRLVRQIASPDEIAKVLPPGRARIVPPVRITKVTYEEV
ncbi:MAG TPA: fibronectin-binding domain-containing protein [Methanomicrobia archaeon]|nr:fibronectin-binding domain-containing protein [Methanomicrobia archaeon]HEX59420.1 fibronectin-binding domain-containing protein [Methanomicrobia archaeon]